MKSITFIEDALKSLDDEVQAVLMNMSISLTEKDDMMLPLLQQKRVLDQTLEDLQYLKANPPAKGGTCKTGNMRKEMEAEK
jgi:hypothetical protein